MARLLITALAGLVVTSAWHERALAQVTYETAIFSASNTYCSQIASGNQDQQGAFARALRYAGDIYPDLIRNDPALFEARVRSKIAEDCPNAAKIAGSPADSCPGVSMVSMQRITAGQPVTIMGGGCVMRFNH